MYIVKIKDKTFNIMKSQNENKKYDVYYNNKKILSFGDRNYQHYYDRFGDFKDLNHKDEKRRESYKKRSEGIGNLDDPFSSNFWSYYFLW
jgi:hypothetical protein